MSSIRQRTSPPISAWRSTSTRSMRSVSPPPSSAKEHSRRSSCACRSRHASSASSSVRPTPLDASLSRRSFSDAPMDTPSPWPPPSDGTGGATSCFGRGVSSTHGCGVSSASVFGAIRSRPSLKSWLVRPRSSSCAVRCLMRTRSSSFSACTLASWSEVFDRLWCAAYSSSNFASSTSAAGDLCASGRPSGGRLPGSPCAPAAIAAAAAPTGRGAARAGPSA
mmetsp:Transcript_109863/g.311568  ORF Transcript_109863/g.311568 Transcript_109863/m.311568 type:complete len:222 (+) Transcript_109863:2918-3583(+)